jgi:antitoxin (DNA-binding transcriptional repressor) of toxin-antitoxin stability system
MKSNSYLRDVKKGKPIAITERGQSVAILMPAGAAVDVQLARELTRKGIGSWKGGKPRGGSRSLAVKWKPVSQIVMDERR